MRGWHWGWDSLGQGGRTLGLCGWEGWQGYRGLGSGGRGWTSWVGNVLATGTSVAFEGTWTSRAWAATRAIRDAAVQSARVGPIHGVVARKCVGVGRGRRARDEERVAADEAADRWVVEPRAELGDAEGSKRVAKVPLAVAVALAAWLLAGQVRI